MRNGVCGTFQLLCASASVDTETTSSAHSNDRTNLFTLAIVAYDP
jgi:hypothetical protein